MNKYQQNEDSSNMLTDSPDLQLKQSTIMMVDDEPIMLEIVQALLEDAGYENFVTIDQSTQAIEKLIDVNPDILLLDLDMPEVNGYEILQRVRTFEKHRFLPILILTAAEDPDSKLKALELGATDFLSKPVDPSELVLRIRNTLSAKFYQDQLAFYDQLTGLPNRKLFIDRLNWKIVYAQREQIPLVLLAIGLDRFRQINETIGLSTGDEILKLSAHRIINIINDSTSLECGKNEIQAARVGGDEFSILLSGHKCIEDCDGIASQLLEAIKQPFKVEGNDMNLTASIGIAVYPKDGEDVETLIKSAATAKEYSKQQGTDVYKFYTREMNDRATAQLKLESDLRTALENSQFELYYQPQINTYTGKVLGLECLIRWIHPEEGFIPPDVFIEVAENMGLIVPLGEWILQQACQTAKKWVDLGYIDLKVSVNISPIQFNDVGFKKSVDYALESTGLNPENLVLEITESMLMGDVEKMVVLLHEVSALGILISLDDFGTGYSSLSYLKKFPIDELKIDKSFLDDVPTKREDNLIVKAIIAMAHGLGQKVVAEGVEEEVQLSFLEAHGCDIIQGYYFSKPLNYADFTEYLIAHGTSSLED